MSSNSSPQRAFASGFESNYYDPEFTADISNKMRVPEKIMFLPDGMRMSETVEEHYSNERNWMHVPEKILVVGGDGHVSGRQELPELKLESSFMQKDEPIQLSTPPHTLTLSDHSYPSIESTNNFSVPNGPRKPNKSNKRSEISKLNLNQCDDNTNNLSRCLESPPSPTENCNAYYNSNSSHTEDVNVKRQLKTLSRRVALLEHENQARYQREVVVYSFGVIYFLLKGLFWIQRHW